MTTENAVDICSNALFLILEVSVPLLLISLIIGLLISIFQTVTSIQEQTLTFVPKVIGIFLALMLLGNWMLNSMVEYTVDLWNKFSYYVHM